MYRGDFRRGGRERGEISREKKRLVERNVRYRVE